jgi:hypothetical protein
MTRCGVDDATCGLQSAIPPCCRAWFPIWDAFTDFARATKGAPLLRRHPIIRARWEYVGCPGCRQCGAKIVIRACPCPLADRNPSPDELRGRWFDNGDGTWSWMRDVDEEIPGTVSLTPEQMALRVLRLRNDVRHEGSPLGDHG